MNPCISMTYTYTRGNENADNAAKSALSLQPSNLKLPYTDFKSNRKAMNRNWSNQTANPALKTKAGNK